MRKSKIDEFGNNSTIFYRNSSGVPKTLKVRSITCDFGTPSTARSPLWNTHTLLLKEPVNNFRVYYYAIPSNLI